MKYIRGVICWVLLVAFVETITAHGAFAVYEVYVDSGSKALAAYQVRIWDEEGVAKILSVEGGEPPAFQAPPFFDPKAIQKNVIKLAAFRVDASEQLPRGKVRVASLHVEIPESGARPRWRVVIEAAATADGRKIAVRASVFKKDEE
ncbi:MAG: hypothetical protein GC138_08770 [Gammaproteobacteria bacterium]|nr:hypothetical protein [Gammaproteobacteria bacterium]